MRYAIALAAVAGLAGAANAQSTQLIYAASVNGGAPTTGPVNASAGDTVVVTVTANFLGAAGLVDGFAALNGKFEILNASTGDSVGNWGAPTVAVTGAAAGVAPGQNGRVMPFGATGSANLPVFTGPAVDGGTGTITGQATNNRIAIGQGPASLAGSSFNHANSGALIFQFTLVLGSSTANRTLHVDAFDINTGAIVNNARWYAPSASTTVNAPVLQTGLDIVVPAPGALALLGLGGLVAGRRRR